MGFIDYVAEYFRGPAGADGATGPEGPSALHVLPDVIVYSDEPVVPDGSYAANFTLPDGATLVSVTPYLPGAGEATAGTFVLDVGPTKLGGPVNNWDFSIGVSGAEGIYEVHARVLYYLP